MGANQKKDFLGSWELKWQLQSASKPIVWMQTSKEDKDTHILLFEKDVV